MRNYFLQKQFHFSIHSSLHFLLHSKLESSIPTKILKQENVQSNSSQNISVITEKEFSFLELTPEDLAVDSPEFLLLIRLLSEHFVASKIISAASESCQVSLSTR